MPDENETTEDAVTSDDRWLAPWNARGRVRV
jgi:hypothetical protein